MGAETFYTKGKGATAQQAFNAAVEAAQYAHGHAGYSGTLAEKHEFVAIEVPVGVAPGDYAEKLVEEGDERIDDKWGPAGAIKLSDDEWLFFGWASS